MQNESTRAQRREEKYGSLKAQGKKKTIDYLYPKEVTSLENLGYQVKVLHPHRTIARCYRCEVTFP